MKTVMRVLLIVGAAVVAAGLTWAVLQAGGWGGEMQGDRPAFDERGAGIASAEVSARERPVGEHVEGEHGGFGGMEIVANFAQMSVVIVAVAGTSGAISRMRRRSRAIPALHRLDP